ncbi:MAG: 2-phospho-L-lactate guanylyltransferase [Gammaproteobacteria bacterium]|nr:2-phospho-L-lactate guanylyltransferase [Gammaproteobacteria bacterium]
MSDMWALLPVKEFSFAKERLSPVLNARERSELSIAMVKDVLSVLSQHSLLEGTLLVSADPLARRLAEQYAVTWLAESSLAAQSLNGVVQASVSYLAEQGIDDVLIIPGDLPLISQEEIARLITAHQRLNPKALTLAPDRVGDGSNCLLCRPASSFRFHYGAGSFRQHLAQARASGMTIYTAHLTGASLDIDTPGDLRELIQRATRNNAPHTWYYLQQIDLASQLNGLQIPPDCTPGQNQPIIGHMS